MLALLALMTTRSGYWAGLDGVLQFLTPWGRRRVRRQSRAEDGRAADGRKGV
jgi:hypothetical protein